jgi:hypothetical protein
MTRKSKRSLRLCTVKTDRIKVVQHCNSKKLWLEFVLWREASLAKAASALVSMYLTRIKIESPQLYQSSLSLRYA